MILTDLTTEPDVFAKRFIIFDEILEFTHKIYENDMKFMRKITKFLK